MNSREDRQREHGKQQVRLKAMAVTSDKPQMVSADVMIQNLLKDSPKKLPQTASTVNPLNHSNAALPLWLQCESDIVPVQYKHLWSLVQSTLNLADTQKVSQLLLTSGLQVDILGFIWNLANKTIPGQLTKQEFYIVLALVSLAQTGYHFSNLSVLKLLTVPIIPVLQVDLQKQQTFQPYELQNPERVNINISKQFSNSLTLQPEFSTSLNENEINNHLLRNTLDEAVLLNNLKSNSVNPRENNEANFRSNVNSSKTQDIHLEKQDNELFENSNFPSIGTLPTAELGDDFSAFQSVPAEKNKSLKDSQSVCHAGDDFTEFQSANIEHSDPFETIVLNQKDIPKIPLPKSFTGKFINLKSNILKISPETEKKLKVLSSNESLSSLPESKISSNNKVSTSISVLGSNHGVGSRLANHSFSTKQDRSKCHKHHKIKINSVLPAQSNAEDDIIFGVNTRNFENVIPKYCPKHSNINKTIILKETKIRSNEISEPSLPEQSNSEPDHSAVPTGENTRQIEIPLLGTFNETVLPTQLKPSVSSFDLITVQEDKYSALREFELGLNPEQNFELKELDDDFGDFLSADIPAPATPDSSLFLDQIVNSNSDLNHHLENEKSDWGDWNFNIETNLHSTNTLSTNTPQNNNITEASSNKAESNFCNSLTLLTLNETFVDQISLPDSYLLQQLDNSTTGTKVEKSDDVATQPKADLTFNTQSDKEFLAFLSADIKSTVEGDFSRYSSLTSLDLKISPTDDSEQETVWRKCLDSCLSLIQEGHGIFNNISIKSVLDQVFASPKTEDYLNYLNIVFQISKRVSRNFNILPSAQEDLEKLWERLQNLCFEYNIKLKHDEDNCSEGKIRCKICLRRIGYNIINQGSNSYHPTCANFWINCVEAVLPFSI